MDSNEIKYQENKKINEKLKKIKPLEINVEKEIEIKYMVVEVVLKDNKKQTIKIIDYHKIFSKKKNKNNYKGLI